MKCFNYTVQDELGLHARPAGQLAKAAAKFRSKIMINKGEKSVDCKRIIALMTLGIKQNDKIAFTFDGDDEDLACKVIEKFCMSFM